MPNRKGRQKGFSPKPKKSPVHSAIYHKRKEREERELDLIFDKLRANGYSLWRPPGNCNWRIVRGRNTYELFFQAETQNWKILPVNRSLERDRLIHLIDKALATKEGT